MRKSVAIKKLGKYMSDEFNVMLSHIDNGEDYFFSTINLLKFIEEKLKMLPENLKWDKEKNEDNKKYN